MPPKCTLGFQKINFFSLSLRKCFGLRGLFFKSEENKNWKTHAFHSFWNEYKFLICSRVLKRSNSPNSFIILCFFFLENYNHSIHGKPKKKNCRVLTMLLPASLHLAQVDGKHGSPTSSQALLGMGAGSSMGAAAATLEGSQNPDTAF